MGADLPPPKDQDAKGRGGRSRRSSATVGGDPIRAATISGTAAPGADQSPGVGTIATVQQQSPQPG